VVLINTLLAFTS